MSTDLKPLGSFALGVACDMTAVVVTQPVDTMITYVMSGKGLPPVAKLFDGMLANSCATLVQGGVPFLVNKVLMNALSKNGKKSDGAQVVAGAGTAALTSLFVTPFERAAKIHQLNECSARKAVSIAAKAPGGLFKAFIPVLGRDLVVFTTYFSGRRILCERLQRRISHPVLREAAASFSLGAAAGGLSSWAARMNILMQGDLNNAYPTAKKTAQSIVKKEGLRAFLVPKGTKERAIFIGTYMVILGLGERYFPPFMPSCFRV